MSDKASSVANSVGAPVEEQAAARTEMTKSVVNGGMLELLPPAELVPVIDFIREGLSEDNMLKGGNIVPLPFLILPLGTSSSGTISLPFVFPAGVPSDFEFFLQTWIPDAQAVMGFAASNAVKGLTP